MVRRGGRGEGGREGAAVRRGEGWREGAEGGGGARCGRGGREGEGAVLCVGGGKEGAHGEERGRREGEGGSPVRRHGWGM